MSDPPFVARASRTKIGITLALSAVMIAFGLGLWLSDELALRLFGSLIALVFAFAAVVSARRLRDERPEFEIDARGILWRGWSDERIPWVAIERAAVRRMRRQRFICLWLRDPDAHRSPRLLGRLTRANRALGFGDIALNPDGAACDLSDLVAAVRRYRPVEGD